MLRVIILMKTMFFFLIAPDSDVVAFSMVEVINDVSVSKAFTMSLRKPDFLLREKKSES